MKWDVFAVQQRAEQLTAVKALILYAASVVGLRGVTWLLMSSPAFYAWTRAHHDLYIGGFFAVQLSITAILAWWLAWKYRTALFLPRPSSDWRRYLAVALIAAPLLLYEGYKVPRYCASVLTLATLKPEDVEGMMRQVWGAMAGGSSAWHVAYSSALFFVGPMLEEIIFTGFVLNRVSRRTHIGVAILVCAALFTASHFLSIMTYVADNAAKLFWMSITAQAIRLASGRLDLAIAFHIAANGLVFTPKLVLAYLYFAGTEP